MIESNKPRKKKLEWDVEIGMGQTAPITTKAALIIIIISAILLAILFLII
jgi:hypothetical protein